MGYEITFICLGIGILLVAYGFWKARRPYEAMNLQLIPTGLFQFVGIFIIFLMLSHLITLYTG